MVSEFAESDIKLITDRQHYNHEVIIMKILVVGCGSIGQRHIRNLKKISNVEVVACRMKGEIKEIEEKFDVKTVCGLDNGLDQKPDAILITTPTSTHIPVALKAAEKGCHLFIEKPISHNLDGVDKFIKIINKNKLICMIGYNLRFHPGLRLIKEYLEKNTIGDIVSARVQAGQYLPDWHPTEDYRTSYSAKKSLGGGVILDLSHEIDYIRWFLGEVKEVFSFTSKLSHLKIETEDVAEILLRFKGGVIGEVHLDYVQRFPSRSCQIIGDEGTILWDFNENKVRLFSAKDKKWQIFLENEKYDNNQTYIDEIKHFINCINRKKKPVVNEIDGKRVLEIVMGVKESSKAKRIIFL
ncbi:MAG: Gfo/Idh/MocA family oxidoreductase [Candidatus Thermoplasmatota archaeon]|nr:Gfo/Idh/MocA family oxidoreductase [Candidatus Thermoplasmatota archaeon]